MKKMIHFLIVIVAFISGSFATMKFIKKDSEEDNTCWKKRADKLNAYYEVTTEWIQTLQNGCCTADYFKKNGYKRIVIYGKGILGELLFEELSKQTGLEIICFADKQSDGDIQFINKIPVVKLEELKNIDCDVIVITPVFAYTEINQMLLAMAGELKIVSLKEIIIECR